MIDYVICLLIVSDTAREFPVFLSCQSHQDSSQEREQEALKFLGTI